MTLTSSTIGTAASGRTSALVTIGVGALALAAILAAPWLAKPFTITLLTEAFVLAIWAMSLNLLSGHAGLLSFGHAAGFGLGGYAAGYFAREVSADVILSLLFAEAVVFIVAALAGDAGTVTVLAEGSLLAEGTLDAVKRDERVIESYLGR